MRHVLVSWDPIKFLLMAVAAMLVLASCSNSAMVREQPAESTQPDTLGSDPNDRYRPPITEFQRYLADGYDHRAKHEDYEHHFEEEKRFARKGREAARGYAVEPDRIGDRRIPSYALQDLIAARARLQRAFDQGMSSKMPKQTAVAQVMFDCWMEEQEEDMQPHDIAFCRGGFERAMAELGAGEEQPPADVEVAACPGGPGCPPPSPFILYFAHDKDGLTPESRSTIQNIISAEHAWKPIRIVVDGHADRSGTEPYNEGLSLRRVKAIQNALGSGGIPRSKILAAHHGERQPRVATPDGVRHPENRRVEIQFYWE